MNISKVIKQLIQENEKCNQIDYKLAYIDGLLDMWNECQGCKK